MDIIEADAQQREEELHKWWQDNWKNIAGGVVLAIALITGMYMYRDYNQKKMYENAGDFYSNVISVNMADAEGVEKVNSFISAHNKDVYSQLAALSLAKQLVSEKKYQEAVDVLSKTVGAGKDTVIDDITRMRIARLNIELKKFDEAEKAIDSLSAKNAEAFNFAALSLKGDLRKAQGKNQEALALYDEALEKATSADDTTIVKMKRDSLKTTAGASVPAGSVQKAEAVNTLEAEAVKTSEADTAAQNNGEEKGVAQSASDSTQENKAE